MWKALKDDIFGHNSGEIFDAPLHAIQVHLERGDVEEVKEIEPIESPKVEAPKKMGRPKGWKPGQKYTPQ